jgi:hypothetical protein
MDHRNISIVDYPEILPEWVIKAMEEIAAQTVLAMHFYTTETVSFLEE